MSNAETVKSTISEIVSGANAAVVAAEEEITGEAVEEMIGTEIMVAEGSIVEDLDTQDHHADVTPGNEDPSVHLLPENRIHMFPEAVVDALATTAGGRLLPRPHFLHLSGRHPNHVHHLLAVEIDQPQHLAHQHLDDADLGPQIDVMLHIGAEVVGDEEELRIVEPVEDHPCLQHLCPVPRDRLSEGEPAHQHPSALLLHQDHVDLGVNQFQNHVHYPGHLVALPAEAYLGARIEQEPHQLQMTGLMLQKHGQALVRENVTNAG
jgi:hypothetical protein